MIAGDNLSPGSDAIRALSRGIRNARRKHRVLAPPHSGRSSPSTAVATRNRAVSGKRWLIHITGATYPQETPQFGTKTPQRYSSFVEEFELRDELLCRLAEM